MDLQLSLELHANLILTVRPHIPPKILICCHYSKDFWTSEIMDPVTLLRVLDLQCGDNWCEDPPAQSHICAKACNIC